MSNNSDTTTVRIQIEKLLHYGIINELIDQSDTILIRNQYLELFELAEPYDETVEFTESDHLPEVLDILIDYAIEKGIMTETTSTYRDIFSTKLLGILTPRQSEVVRKFRQIQQEESIEQATDFFYHFSKATNYIRVHRIKKNISWKTHTEYGDLDISINLSKPEKDPKEIAKLGLVTETKYPKCPLCLENVGYVGRINHPARQNHRVIPVKLRDQQWYFQYSPYVYYNEHCIVFSEEHSRMIIDGAALARMLDFVDQYPHYFLGANAGLPIVGGSILTHDHYQGGRASFPIENTEIDLTLEHDDYPHIRVLVPRWCLSMVRLEGCDQSSLLELATYILDQWKAYTDVDVEIRAYSQDEKGEQIPHNAITPIVRKSPEGSFSIDLILRNNRTTELHPDGIFHTHKDLHHIKKENIGVIEVMGLAILPGRLDRELGEIQKILTGQKPFSLAEIQSDDHMLQKHLPWIEELVEKYGTLLDEDKADRIIKDEVGYKFLAVLKDVSVFKPDEQGQNAFRKFLQGMGFKIKD